MIGPISVEHIMVLNEKIVTSTKQRVLMYFAHRKISFARDEVVSASIHLLYTLDLMKKKMWVESKQIAPGSWHMKS